ncbi:MAG: NosD domain-containing protein, partial [Conexivisphaera sp.]
MARSRATGGNGWTAGGEARRLRGRRDPDHLVPVIIAAILLAATLSVIATQAPRQAQAQGSTVKFLSGCANITSPGYYELSADVSGEQGAGYCIGIFSSNVVLDANGHSMEGGGSGIGIYVADSVENVTIKNLGGMEGYSYGVFINSSRNIKITYDTLSASKVSLYIYKSNNISVAYSSVESSGSGYALYIYKSNNISVAYSSVESSGSGYALYIYKSNNISVAYSSVESSGSGYAL